MLLILCSVRVSNELGRGDSKAAKFSILITVLTSFSIGLVLFFVFLFLRERLSYIFTSDPKVAEAVGDLSPLLSISMLLNSVQPVLSGNYYYYYHLIFLFIHLIKTRVKHLVWNCIPKWILIFKWKVVELIKTRTWSANVMWIHAHIHEFSSKWWI